MTDHVRVWSAGEGELPRTAVPPLAVCITRAAHVTILTHTHTHARTTTITTGPQVVNNSVSDRPWGVGPGVGPSSFPLAFPVALGSTWVSTPSVRVWLDDHGVATLLRFNKGPLGATRWRP